MYRLLSRRDYGRFELEQRLRKKWPDGDVTEIVEELAAEGLVSDQRFAESFVRARVRRLQGPIKIRAELKGRRISDAIIESALAPDDLSWTELASEWLNRQSPELGTYKQNGRYYRRLQNRGFTHDQAMNAIQQITHTQASIGYTPQDEQDGP